MKITQRVQERARNFAMELGDTTAAGQVLGDCRLVCKDGSSLTWHKALLSDKSSVLRDIMGRAQGGGSCCGCDCDGLKYDTIMLPDFEVEVVGNVLQWMMTGQVLLWGLHQVQQVTSVLQTLGIAVNEDDFVCEEVQSSVASIVNEGMEGLGTSAADSESDQLGLEEDGLGEAEDEAEGDAAEAATTEQEESSSKNQAACSVCHQAVTGQVSADWHRDYCCKVVLSPLRKSEISEKTNRSDGKEERGNKASGKGRRRSSSAVGRKERLITCFVCRRDVSRLLEHLTMSHYRVQVEEAFSGLIGSARQPSSGLYSCTLCVCKPMDLYKFTRHIGSTHRMVLRFLEPSARSKFEDMSKRMMQARLGDDEFEKKRSESDNGQEPDEVPATKRTKVDPDVEQGQGSEDEEEQQGEHASNDGGQENGEDEQSGEMTKCHLCDVQIATESPSDLLSHLVLFHYRERLEADCAEILRASKDLADNKKGSVKQEGEESYYKCTMCRVHQPESELTFLVHLGVTHGLAIPVLDAKALAEIAPRRAAAGRRLRCSLCPSDFEPSGLIRHYALRHFRSQFMEDHRVAMSKSLLHGQDEARTRLSLLRYRCDLCGSPQTGQDALLGHLASAHKMVMKYLPPEFEAVLFPAPAAKKNDDADVYKES